jgi:hypothetical protein
VDLVVLGKSNGEYFLSANGDWADIIPAVEKLVGDNPNVVICLVGNCTMSLDGGECLEVVDAYLFPDGTTPPTAVAVRAKSESNKHHSERILAFSEMGFEWKVVPVAQGLVRILTFLDNGTTTLEELNSVLQQQIGLPVFHNSNLFLLGHDDLWKLDHFKQVKLGQISFSFQNPLAREDDDIGEEVNADPLRDVKKFKQWVADFVDRFDLDEDHRHGLQPRQWVV